MSAAARKAGRGLCGALFDEVLDKCLKGWNTSMCQARFGRGDRKTRRGKIFRGTWAEVRPRPVSETLEHYHKERIVTKPKDFSSIEVFEQYGIPVKKKSGAS